MSVSWVFAVITLAAVFVAAFAGDIRRATLSLWVAGLAVGAVYLTLGAEVLAIVQWIVSTLVAVSFVFFSAMFGEYGSGERIKLDRRLVKIALGGLAGLAFAWVVALGTGALPDGLSLNTSTGEITGTPTNPGTFTFQVCLGQQQGGGGPS